MNNPDIFILSVPKSGTHLVKQIITGLPQYKGAKGIWLLPNQNFMKILLEKEEQKKVILSHMPYNSTLQTYLINHNNPRIFIYRDPRDVIVSWLHYVEKKGKDYFQYDFLFNTLKNNDERIMYLINGFKFGFEKEDIDRFNINDLINPYLRWCEDSETFCIKYESLIQNEIKSLKSIINYLSRYINFEDMNKSELIESMKANNEPSTSKTFRKGVVGDWKETFNKKHKQAFKENAGDLLIKLGYEKDFNW